MTTTHKISPDDPRLTAFALGELEGEELAAVEAALRDDPAARAAVDEIRTTAASLEAALGAEPMVPPAAVARPLRSTAIIAGSDPRKLDGGPLGKLIKFPQPKFPQLYYVIGGLAAAAFAVLVAYRGSPVHVPAEKKSYLELTLQSAALEAGAKNEAPQSRALDAAAKSVRREQSDKKRDESAGRAADVVVAAAPVTVQSQLFQSGAADANRQLQADSLQERAGKDEEMQMAKTMAPAQRFKEEPKPSLPAVPSPTHFNMMAVGSVTGGLAASEQNQAYRKAKAPAGATFGGVDLRLAERRVPQLAADRADAGMAGGTVSLNLPDPVQAPAAAKTEFNTEGYAYSRDNDFLEAAGNPLSTFAIDVDTASYANVRRFLADGQLPPADAVRIEELVNYFPYRYAPPAAGGKDGAPFAASMEVAEAPWAPSHRLVRIGLKGREVSTAERAAANLVFLLDVSGSMDEPNKLPLVQEAMRLLIAKLRPDDRVAIVVYAGASGLALPSTPVAKSREILAALDALTPGGSTNGAMGIQLAYDIAKANFVTGGLNRVILCTDGDFNVGVTSEGELTRLIEEKAKSGVFLTVLGFGMGNYKDATLEQLADKGNGNYGYIDTRREAEKLLVEQVNGTLVTIAKDVKLQVEFNPALVASYRLIGYENRLLKKEDFNNDAVDAGEIGAGHTVTALYEIVPVGAEGKVALTTPAVDELKYRASENSKLEIGNSKSSELLTLKVRYKEPAGAVSRKLEFALVDAGARFAAATADFKFAAAVAEFGMILRESPHKGTGTLAEVLAWAQAGTDSDAGGYRGEFIGLVRQAQALLR